MFQPRERTLTDAEIEAACQKVVAAVAKATGADAALNCLLALRDSPRGLTRMKL